MMTNFSFIIILLFSSILTARTQYSKCEGDKLEDRQIIAVKDALEKSLEKFQGDRIEQRSYFKNQTTTDYVVVKAGCYKIKSFHENLEKCKDCLRTVYSKIFYDCDYKTIGHLNTEDCFIAYKLKKD